MRIDLGPFKLNSLASANNKWTGTWRVPPDLPFFEGHFPGRPILPAMIIMEASLAFVHQVSAEPLSMPLRAKHCKFRSPIEPNRIYEIHLEQCDVRSADGRGSAAKGSVGLSVQEWLVSWHLKAASEEPLVHLSFSGVSGEAP